MFIVGTARSSFFVPKERTPAKKVLIENIFAPLELRSLCDGLVSINIRLLWSLTRSFPSRVRSASGVYSFSPHHLEKPQASLRTILNLS